MQPGPGRTGKFEHFRGEVLEDRGGVHGGLRADAHVVLRALLKVSVNTADGELRDKRDVSASFVKRGAQGA